MTADVSLSVEEKNALAARCWRSPVELARIFLPHWFPSKMPWVHRGILALRTGKTEFLLDFGPERWRDEPDASWGPDDLEKILTNFVEELPDGKPGAPLFKLELVDGAPKLLFTNVKAKIAVIMPRGFSKTTIMNLANLSDILYRNEDFFLYVSESGAHAERQLGTIKFELTDEEGNANNPLIYEVFGAFNPPRNSQLKWTENYIEPLNGCMVGAVGRGGQIRGFGKRAKRPGIITYDDLEDAESVTSDTQRKKDTKWFFGTALPTTSRMGRSFLIGTLLHNDAILNKAMKNREFTVVRFGAIDRQGDALWAFMMDLEDLEDKKSAMTEVGELSSFYLEYMSEYKVDESRMFPENKLVYLSKPYSSFVGISLVMDPAISEESNADFVSVACCGIERGGVKHVLDCHLERGMDPAAQVDKFFEFHQLHMMRLPPEFRKHGIEAIGYQRSLIHLVRGEQFKRSRTLGQDAYFEVIPIFHGKTGKIPRIKGMLKPLVQANYLTFQTMWPELHQQFVDFPQGKKDGPDSVAMAISLLDPFASLNLSDDFDPTADSAQSVESECGGNFRRAP